MTMYLEISNYGEVNPLAFILMGASTKANDDTKIGMFGSGNKYAIACLMRENVSFVIYKGKRALNFTTRTVKMGENEYQKIMVNGKNTSLTTAMGKDWKVWQAIRELYANAMDEGLIKFDYSEEMNPEAGKTKIYMELKPDVEEVLQNKHKYFSDGRTVLAESPIGKIYRNEGTPMRIYRKGIRCFEGNEHSLFDYDFNEIEISESRIIMYSWQLHATVWRLLFSTDNQTILRKLVTEMEGTEYYETTSIASGWVNTYDADWISKGWETLLKEKYLVSKAMYEHSEQDEQKKSIVIPNHLHHILEVHFTDSSVEVSPPSFKKTEGQRYKAVTEYTTLQIDILEKALGFFQDSDFDIPYEIVIVSFIKPDTLGSIEKDGNLILVGEKSIELGVHDTINTIMEEYIHLKHSVADETREFQTAVINELINYMKKRTGVIV